MESKTNVRREELKDLSAQLKMALKLARMQDDSITMNDLIINHYQQTNNVTDLKTFNEWKALGYSVKKGEKSFVVWGSPVKLQQKDDESKQQNGDKQDSKKQDDYFPICHLFDIKQVHKIGD